jgi:hypothetical protein
MGIAPGSGRRLEGEGLATALLYGALRRVGGGLNLRETFRLEAMGLTLGVGIGTPPRGADGVSRGPSGGGTRDHPRVWLWRRAS